MPQRILRLRAGEGTQTLICEAYYIVSRRNNEIAGFEKKVVD